ncbi:ribosome recycling factor [Aphanomyces astaci]|uniref:Ribosome recycling factor n=1 Tax=Aphanomyces astaci TaxID=112090 RepID=W4GB32_APHAT|nr:ribosome recycling factor [Aphanomyces astaci]ETV76148.1 ribosome recycling factor [Aphanomyces astaci]|eukprot:XP_009834273.1 ribosome recycling factor [Aphanomyces astaci]
MFGRILLRTSTPSRLAAPLRSFAKKAKGGKATEPAAATEALGDVAKKTHDEVKKNMRGAVANYIKVLSAMRPGQADAGIFDSLMVSAYGQMASLTELAQVSVVGPTELAVTIYDPSLLTDIRTGIEGLNPSFSVQPSGATLSVRFPKMTKETRDELVKAAKKQAESARQHVRRVRQDGMNEIKKLKDSISEDDVKVEQDKIQKLTDDHIAEITRLLASKERALAVI